MMNLTDSVTITGGHVTSIDPLTGTPTRTTSVVTVNQPCAFTVLSAAQTEQSWGSDFTTSESVAAHLILPKWSVALDQQFDAYKIDVLGYPQVWKIVATRPGASWTTYLLTKS